VYQLTGIKDKVTQRTEKRFKRKTYEEKFWKFLRKKFFG
jgi:hypothetical protein